MLICNEYICTGMCQIEKLAITWFAQKIVGYDVTSDGFFTSGGSAGTVIAMWAARNTFQHQNIQMQKYVSGTRFLIHILLCEA